MTSKVLQEFSLGNLQRDNPAMTGTLSKLLPSSSSSNKVWKPCQLILTSLGVLYLFKVDATPSSLPIACLTIRGSVGFFDPVLNGFILHVSGDVLNVEGGMTMETQKKKWIFKSSSEEILDGWVFAIDEVCPKTQESAHYSASSFGLASPTLTYEGLLTSPGLRGMDNEFRNASVDIGRSVYSETDYSGAPSVESDRSRFVAKADSRRTPTSTTSAEKKKWFDFFVNG
ncbi:UNVERIFIED_CONTAM: hypothetical protein HDU68_012079 [Siphonaria sp. JEL0065]|nr:hypothetical protein HDU68_012079 [Siphonaria sp. JEL0065]